MRLIKFRAKAETLGDVTVYGIGYSRTTCAYDLLVKEDFKLACIKRGTVKQLVGWDGNRNEVYEDDILVDEEGNEYVASLDATLYSASKATSRIWTPEPCDVCETTLKLKGSDSNERQKDESKN